MSRRTLCLLAIAGLGLTACDSVSGPETGADLSINFSSVTPEQSSSAASGAFLSSEWRSITGSNGTLAIDDIRLIVAEFKLERAEAEEDICEDLPTEEEEEACEEEYEEEYESDPYFLQVPLDGSTVNAAQQPVPSGEYTELKFEVEDIDLDEIDDEDDDEQRGIQAVVDAIAAAGYDDWPTDASMVVTGSFTPEGSTEAVPFKAYFEAEVEVEMEFPEPLVISEDESTQSITIQLDPAAWFTNADGTVIDLSEYDYTGNEDDLFEFEVKMEDGFTKIELDD